MKRFSLAIIIGFFCFLSCHEECLERKSTDTSNLKSRSTQTTSDIYDWEKETKIPLLGISTDVVLPWYTGANIAIANNIINDYKSADGWKMIYNTCTTSNLSTDGCYYLFFYNIFSGKLRAFVYNKNNVTGSQTTFWQLNFSSNTSLVNDAELITQPLDNVSDNKCLLTTNITNGAAKAIGYGWNCFEYDLIVYDSNLTNQNLTMSFNAYDVNETTLDADGILELSSEGTILTTSVTTTSDKTLSNYNTIKQDVGNNVQNYYKNYTTSSTATRGILSSISKATDIINKGYNLITKKFSGKQDSITISQSDVKITTKGDIKLQGTLNSTQNSNVYPIANLLVPGATPTPQNTTLPSYSDPIGVWSLETTPILAQCRESIKSFYSKGIQNGKYVGHETWDIYLTYDPSTFKVNFNPAIEELIEKYEVKVDLVAKEERATSTTYPYSYLKSNVICSEGNTYIQTSTTAGPSISTIPYLVYYLCDKTEKTIETSELKNYNKRSTDDVKFPSDINIELKVSVTIYPKVPYNTTPITTTRTYPYTKSSTKIELI